MTKPAASSVRAPLPHGSPRALEVISIAAAVLALVLWLDMPGLTLLLALALAALRRRLRDHGLDLVLVDVRVQRSDRIGRSCVERAMRAPVMLVLVLLRAMGHEVRADAPTTATAVFASGMGIDESTVGEVQDFRLKGTGDYRRAIIGRFKNGDLTLAGAVLVWCDAKEQCWASHAWIGAANNIEILGLIDLGARKAQAFPTRGFSNYERELELAGKPRWPALLVRVTEREQTTTGSRYGGEVKGEHRRVELAVLSLTTKDEGALTPTMLREVVDEHWPTGSGVNVTFALESDGSITATEQRDLESRSMCLRPAPTTTHYKLDTKTRRFERAVDLAHTGCGAH